MNPTLVLAREIRIQNDRKRAAEADARRRGDDESSRMLALAATAVRDAFDGVATRHGRISVRTDPGRVLLTVPAGESYHYVEVERGPDRFRYAVDGWGSRKYSDVAALLAGLAAILADDLDLEDRGDRPIVLSAAEREALRSLIATHPAIGVDRKSLLQRLEG